MRDKNVYFKPTSTSEIYTDISHYCLLSQYNLNDCVLLNIPTILIFLDC